MQADFAARSTTGNPTEQGNDLMVDTITLYHQNVFGVFGAPIEAWTPFTTLSFQNGEAGREALWDNLLDGVIGMGETFLDTLIASATGVPGAASYLLQLTLAGGEASTSPSNEFGPYTITNSITGGLIIGGNQSDNTLQGSQNDDVMMGFDGNDVFIATTGNDRIYGGDGSELVMSMVFGIGLEPFIDTVDYRGLSGTVTATINVDDVGVIKSVGGTDTLTDIESIFGTAQADTFIINSFQMGEIITINGGSILVPPGNVVAVGSESGRSLSAAEVFAQFGGPENIEDQDTVTVAQSLLDAGAAVTYLSAVGEGVIYLGDQRVTYTGIFNEPVQQPEDFFAGIPVGGSVELDDVGNIVLDLSGIGQGITSELLSGITLWNLVDEVGATDFDDSFDLAQGGEFNALAGNDAINGSSEADMINGDAGDDFLTGGDGVDTLDGGDGGDILFGGGARDFMFGGDGNDILSGGDGGDIQRGGAGNDQISGQSGADTQRGEAGNDTIFGGPGNDIMFGGDGDDSLNGGADNDALLGGVGDDTLAGQGGNDNLRGNAGADTFIFSSNAGIDTIKDFQNGTDIIDFSAHSSYNSLSDVLAAVFEFGTATVIYQNVNNFIILDNTSISELDSSDFDFGGSAVQLPSVFGAVMEAVNQAEAALALPAELEFGFGMHDAYIWNGPNADMQYYDMA